MSIVQIRQGSRSVEVDTEDGRNLLDIIREQGFYIESYCGGNGTCGKCTVNIKYLGKDNHLKHTEEDTLACMTSVSRGMVVTIPEISGADIKVEISGNDSSIDSNKNSSKDSSNNLNNKSNSRNTGRTADLSQGIGIAVDLGTTTVAVKAVSLSDGQVLGVRTGRNSQCTYGADVISRIKYIDDHDDGLNTLGIAIRSQISDMMYQLIGEIRDTIDHFAKVKRVFIAGNTIMEHIFAGINPSEIAKAPYVPPTLFRNLEPFDMTGLEVAYKDDRGSTDNRKAYNCKSIVKWEELWHDADIYISPCVSGYVGGDITAGLMSTGAAVSSGEQLFMDVGTNGEMALSGPDGIISCSVATGPAFEGAEISCGMAGSPGAIDSVTLSGSESHADGEIKHSEFHSRVIDSNGDLCNGDLLKFTTVDNRLAIGICGSGLIDLLAVLVRNGAVDETGRLLPPGEAREEGVPTSLISKLREDEDGNGVFYITNDISFTAGDVRKLQLAKAAIAAGINVLLREKGLKASDITKLYIAGGFGKHLSPCSIAEIGMIPAELKDRIVYLGNASLNGAVLALTDVNKRDELISLCKKIKYIELSGSAEFTEEYIEQMMFEEE